MTSLVLGGTSIPGLRSKKLHGLKPTRRVQHGMARKSSQRGMWLMPNYTNSMGSLLTSSRERDHVRTLSWPPRD